MFCFLANFAYFCVLLVNYIGNTVQIYKLLFDYNKLLLDFLIKFSFVFYNLLI